MLRLSAKRIRWVLLSASLLLSLPFSCQKGMSLSDPSFARSAARLQGLGGAVGFGGMGGSDSSEGPMHVWKTSPDPWKPRPSVGSSPCGSRKSTGIWRKESFAITISSFNFFSGAGRFHADCSRLDELQRKLLAELPLVRSEKSPYSCGTDPHYFNIEVHDSGGVVRKYQASSNFRGCKDEPDFYADYQALSKFQKTAKCFTSGTLRQFNRASRPAEIEADDGCEHGVFSGPAWLELRVDYPGTYRFAASRCTRQKGRVTVFAPGRIVPLARGSKAQGKECWVTEYEFPRPGLYPVKIESKTKGDFFVVVTSRP